MKKAKIGAIGENDVMLIFKAVGIDVFPATDIDNASEILRKLVKEEYGIIFITESIASQMDKLIQEYASMMLPSIVVVPGLGEKSNYAIERLRQAIIKAVGADIISEK